MARKKSEVEEVAAEEVAAEEVSPVQEEMTPEQVAAAIRQSHYKSNPAANKSLEILSRDLNGELEPSVLQEEVVEEEVVEADGRKPWE